MLYHITSGEEAEQASALGRYEPRGFATEGFIHCSYADQVCRVANARFNGRKNLVLLEIDPALLNCKVVDENLEDGSEQFPHVYGTLPMAAVVRILPFPCDQAGEFHSAPVPA
jgi:uncharacterized protein (DUF952 family)